MMPSEVTERDWKIFRELREVALERLCERALGEALEVIEKPDASHHDRFLDLFSLIIDRNRAIARGFDDPRRSTMVIQLSFMQGLGLLGADELARFSEGTREMLQSLAELR